jgi:HTH-type transcriptional regulator / antitoxin MqsA
MTRQCGECGAAKAMRAFNGKTFAVEHAGARRAVKNLSGWRCEGCGEVVFDAASAKRYVAAGDALVLRERALRGAEVRRIREKLGLTQQQAGALTGGGHNAFSRYERGEAAPMQAVINLLRLLDKHPQLLNDPALRPLADANAGERPKRAARARAGRD